MWTVETLVENIVGSRKGSEVVGMGKGEESGVTRKQVLQNQ